MEICECCGCSYDTVYRVPDAIWATITEHDDGSGSLCPDCCDGLARRAGIELYWEADIEHYPTELRR